MIDNDVFEHTVDSTVADWLLVNDTSALVCLRRLFPDVDEELLKRLEHSATAATNGAFSEQAEPKDVAMMTFLLGIEIGQALGKGESRPHTEEAK